MKENEEGNLPSSNQIDVVELTRFALSRSLSKRLEYAKAREDRLESIQQYMKENKMSEKQKREIEEKFSRDFRKSLRLQRCTPSVDDYRTLGIIGRGSRGEIRLVRHKESNTVHAMKVFSKSDTISHGEINSVLREKDILRMINHPGVERLELAFQDVRNVYLILEFLVGGDLATILERRSRLNEEEARFLVAQIASTLNFLHTEHDIVYRDLKPDNIVFDRFGVPKLVDFGSARWIPGRNPMLSTEENERFASIRMTSLSGFPDYQSPEMIANDQGYGTETDLWSLGCVLYECLIGKPPFSSSDPDPLLTAWNVLHYEEHFQFPRECPLSSEAEDLIRCLLTDSDRRINFSGMKAHKFFQGFDWDGMNKMKSPFAFSTEIEADLSNFDLYEDIHVTSGLNGCSHLQFKRLPEQLAFDGWEWTRQEEISFNKKHPFNFLCIRTFFFYYDARLLMCS